jgi:hypothetical protein
MSKKSGFGIQDQDPGVTTRIQFFGLKYFDVDPGWKKFGSEINIPDPQHYIYFGYILKTTHSPPLLPPPHPHDLTWLQDTFSTARGFRWVRGTTPSAGNPQKVAEQYHWQSSDPAKQLSLLVNILIGNFNKSGFFSPFYLQFEMD